MKLARVRISNFQSFGAAPTTLIPANITYLLGANGTGKTAFLQALSRMFGVNPGLRRIRPSDFHRPLANQEPQTDIARLWIEATFDFAELKLKNHELFAIAPSFAHMRLASKDGVPEIRFRLTATMDANEEVDESLQYVIETDQYDEPIKTKQVSNYDRYAIQVHYLPARRDPTDHVSYAPGSLLGRALRAANWTGEREVVGDLAREISKALAANSAIGGIASQLSTDWSALHRGDFFSKPNLSFDSSSVDTLLQRLTVTFSPGHDQPAINFSRLSDGQQSLLYVSLVLSIHAIGRKALSKEISGFDVTKLRPAVFTLVAIEEPENSLSQHNLGRLLGALDAFANQPDAQAVVATHSPLLLRRVVPESLRHLRLNAHRESVVRPIPLPAEVDEAYRFVREAVQAFPEIYFSRLVVLGEGDSEEIFLPRLLKARGVGTDDVSISVAPLGGRHVSHFWRLLNGLGIPYVTLLDFDLGRHEGGWGRIRYVVRQLLRTPNLLVNKLTEVHLAGIPTWDSDTSTEDATGKQWLAALEEEGVFFSKRLDLDFALLRSFPDAYSLDSAELVAPDQQAVKSVFGKTGKPLRHYDKDERLYLRAYYDRFKLGSKPAAHLTALSRLEDGELIANVPAEFERMLKFITKKLAAFPE